MDTNQENKKKSLLDMEEAQLKQQMADMGEPSFRAQQIHEWLLRGEAFEDMSNLPLEMREKLRNTVAEGYPEVLELQTSTDGTQKFLLELADKNTIETVYLPKDYGNSVCLSTQVGCSRGCAFCASSKGGFVRNLTAGEMLGQIITVNKNNPGHEISHIVLMGMGEPLDNYEQVLRFLHMVNAEDGLNIGKRSISLSTCGVTDKIYRLADDFPGITLSVSLHATTQNKREVLMPSAKEYPLEDILAAAKHYFEESGRRIVYEYVLIDGFNDGDEDARQLHKLLKHQNCHVNIIPLNKSGQLKAPKTRQIHGFCKKITDLGLSATVRQSMGSDIKGACGQLRQRTL